MTRTYNEMYIYRSENPPRQVFSKYMIALHLSTDVIMNISLCSAVAASGGSCSFLR